MPNVSSFNVVHHVPTFALLEGDGKSVRECPAQALHKAQMALQAHIEEQTT